MRDTRSRHLLVSVIEAVKQFLIDNGWNVVSAIPDNPTPRDVFVDESFPEEKTKGNMVGIGYTDIEEPLPVELGNSKRVKQIRVISCVSVGMKENIAQALALDIKAFFDSIDYFQFTDEQGGLVGTIRFGETEARRVFSEMPEEWRKFMWATNVSTEEYFDLP